MVNIRTTIKNLGAGKGRGSTDTELKGTRSRSPKRRAHKKKRNGCKGVAVKGGGGYRKKRRRGPAYQKSCSCLWGGNTVEEDAEFRLLGNSGGRCGRAFYEG